jgi:ABC-type sugar transport system ATPase subunit
MSDRVVLEMRNITKLFPGVVALDGVDFTCRAGEVHAVAGQNGAGKSTLMKIIAGVYQPDGGEIRLDGRPIHITSTHHAQKLGISIIHQELNLLPDFTVAENVFLGREPRHLLGFVNTRELEARALDLFKRLAVDLDPHIRVERLSLAQQQMVEIAKALSINARLVIMDEPSATLGGHDLLRVFETISALKQQGVAIIYISHRLEEVFDVADHVTVFRDGRAVASRPITEITRGELVRLMVGRDLTETFPEPGQALGEEILTVRDLSAGDVLHDINLSVRCGEIVGISGLMGSGRTELAQTIFGVRPYERGDIRIRGQQVHLKSPQDALKHGMAFLPESRKEEGIVACLSVQHNAALPSLDARQVMGFIQTKRDRAVVQEQVNRLNVRTPSLRQEIQFLSGGNQQKVVLSKWLLTGAELLIFDEPTRGIDVGAKAEIWHLMRELANRGHAILMISSELSEIMGMSDRILVLYKGRIAATLPRAEATAEKVLAYATYGDLEHDDGHNSHHA